MPYAFDPEIEAAIRAARDAMGDVEAPKPGDWRALRTAVESQLAALNAIAPAASNVQRKSYETVAADGARIALRWYSKSGAHPGSAVLYIHGGGMILGSIELYDSVVAAYVAASGVPMLSVEYRLAPEYPHPTPVEDCFAGIRWLAEHAKGLGVDSARLGVMGDSAGGGLAAGVALLARERQLSLAKQVLIYPMLDNRNTRPDETLAPFATWTYDNNLTAWTALLGNLTGTDTVPPSAAPSRATIHSGMACAYLEVGQLDIFRDETIEYARRLALHGNSIDLHVYAGAPHGFDRIAPESNVAKRAMADRVRALLAI